MPENDDEVIRRVQTVVGRGGIPVRDQALDAALQQRAAEHSINTPYSDPWRSTREAADFIANRRSPFGAAYDGEWGRHRPSARPGAMAGLRSIADYDSMDAYQRAVQEEADRREVAHRLFGISWRDSHLRAGSGLGRYLADERAEEAREAEYANWLRALTNDEPLMSPRDELEYLLAGGG